MKNRLFRILICGLLILGITGCNSKDNKPSLKELTKINDQITQYFQSNNVEYDNFSFNYIDERGMVIVVGLLDNTEEQQVKFRECVVDYDYLVFLKADFKYYEEKSDNNNNNNNITLN